MQEQIPEAVASKMHPDMHPVFATVHRSVQDECHAQSPSQGENETACQQNRRKQ